jgi:putative peptidoglycan lipid II flippase
MTTGIQPGGDRTIVSASAHSAETISQEVGPLGFSGSTVLRNGFAGSIWTVVARLIGFGRTITVGAVLGVTYLGNTYQSINSLPNLVYYQLLAGSLFAALLIPPLVRHLDRHDEPAAQRLVQGVFGTFLTCAVALSAILVAIGPFVMRLVTIGVSDPGIAAAQRRVGWLFLVMFVPQITLYLVAGTGAAVMNARGRFALAAAAPALESLGMIAVMVAAWVTFRTETGLLHISDAQLLLLGLGTTAAVGAHATCQWLGARSSGIIIRPRWAWRDDEVTQLLRRALPMLAFSCLEALQIFAVIVVSNRIRGGVVAFQLALNLFFLPTAIITWPIARALLPQLTKWHSDQEPDRFHEELVRAVSIASFVTVPIAAAYVAFAWPIARVIAFGRLHEAGGVGLIAPSIAALALAVVGETWFILATYGCYARHDVRTPLRCMVVRVGVALAFMTLAMFSHGRTVLVLLGLSLSIGSVAGAIRMGWRLRDQLPSSGPSMARSVGGTALMSVLMVLPAVLVMLIFGEITSSKLLQVTELAGLLLLSAGIYVSFQLMRGAPEIAWLKSTFIRRDNDGGRGDGP